MHVSVCPRGGQKEGIRSLGAAGAGICELFHVVLGNRPQSSVRDKQCQSIIYLEIIFSWDKLPLRCPPYVVVKDNSLTVPNSWL